METIIPRKLNMDEKRKLEKLILEDIDRAASAYSQSRSEAHKAIEESILEKPSPEVAKLLATYREAVAKREATETALEKHGFRISSFGDKLALNYRQGNLPAVLREHETETLAQKTKFDEVKRGYTLKLFAGGVEAQELFAALATELSALRS